MTLHTFTFSSPHPTLSELRISFATQFTAYPLLHQHTAGRLISRHSPAQYKTIDGAPGIIDGAGFSKQVYHKYDEIKIRRA
jgi:hypothetical protein